MYTSPIKTCGYQLQLLFIAQMATKCNIVQLRQNHTNTTTTTIRNYWTKMIVNQLTQQTVPILKLQRTSLCRLTFTHKPTVSALLLLYF